MPVQNTLRRLALIAGAASTLVVPLALTGCGDDHPVRTDPNAVRDLSGNWNATDSNNLANKAIADITTAAWITNFQTKFNRNPVIKVGRVANRSSEDINTNIFTNDIRRALLNTGKVDVVASNGDTGQARDERKDQDVNASADSRHESFAETGADFLLEGAVETQNDQKGSAMQKFYAADLNLTDVKSQKIVWEGIDKIAKDIDQSSYK
jgi:uncharacterized protein (TIGR02722 family)